MKIKTLGILLLTLLLIHCDWAIAKSQTEISQDITTLYRAARKVISVNQSHINDATIGDKGLSGPKVVAMALKNYLEAIGTALDPAHLTKAEQAILDAVKTVMDENQDLINEKGIGFKGFLPAIFARQVANKFNATMVGKMSIKLTAPKAYVRNRANRPDKWEHNIIETQFKQANYSKGKPFSEKSTINEQSVFRFILPEYYGPSCLSCHGEPTGERDISGGKKEGGKLDELGGAISLVIFE